MKRLTLFAALSVLLLTPGCGPAGEGSPEAEARPAQVEQAVWTGSTSEEAPPITCHSQCVSFALGCSGYSCDYVSLNCLSPPSGAVFGSVTWTQPFSEETQTPTLCPTGSWVTGLSCSGGYCDNVSLECTYITGRSASDCQWSPWVSDETSSWGAPAGYFLRGAKCRGWWCDDFSLYYCKMS